MLRAGDGELADETRSLERIGSVIDVHRLAAAFIAGLALGKQTSRASRSATAARSWRWPAATGRSSRSSSRARC